MGKFGIPRTIITDNAPFPKNDALADCLAQLMITHRFSTPHHHEGNATAELMIQTLQEKMSLVMNQPNGVVDWESALHQALLAINTTKASSTGIAPFEMIFGRQHAFTDFELVDTEGGDYLAAKRKRVVELAASASSSQVEAKATAKRYFDKHHMARSFEQNEKVCVRKEGRLPELANKWDGPFEVAERKSHDIYRMKNLANGKVIERHVSDMKKFIATALLLLCGLLLVVCKLQC